MDRTEISSLGEFGLIDHLTQNNETRNASPTLKIVDAFLVSLFCVRWSIKPNSPRDDISVLSIFNYDLRMSNYEFWFVTFIWLFYFSYLSNIAIFFLSVFMEETNIVINSSHSLYNGIICSLKLGLNSASISNQNCVSSHSSSHIFNLFKNPYQIFLWKLLYNLQQQMPSF